MASNDPPIPAPWPTMTPEQIREAVWSLNPGKRFTHPREMGVLFDMALAYVESLENPIWWCFERGTHSKSGEVCIEYRASGPLCDITLATRPRRIE